MLPDSSVWAGMGYPCGHWESLSDELCESLVKLENSAMTSTYMHPQWEVQLLIGRVFNGWMGEWMDVYIGHQPSFEIHTRRENQPLQKRRKNWSPTKLNNNQNSRLCSFPRTQRLCLVKTLPKTYFLHRSPQRAPDLLLPMPNVCLFVLSLSPSGCIVHVSAMEWLLVNSSIEGVLWGDTPALQERW